MIVTIRMRVYEQCPIFPEHAKVIHQGFDDPPTLASGIIDEELALSHNRRVRDEIEQFILNLGEYIP